MLTPRRALFLALACIAFLVILHQTHDDRKVHRADQLPRPAPVSSRLNKDDDEPPAPVPSVALFDPSPPPQYKPRVQLPLSEIRKKPLSDQLAYEFPYDLDAKFPAYVWQTWKTTPSSNDFEHDFRELESSWSRLHPNFVHEVITDSVAAHLVKHLYAALPEVIEAYDALPVPVLKADFFRYLILLARGGIYTDIDTGALKSAADWVPPTVPRSSYGMVVGIEADPAREDWAQWYSRRIQFCQWTIQSKPGHPILRDTVANITTEALRLKKDGKLATVNVDGIVEFTGPAQWTDRIFDFFNNPEYFDVSSNSEISWQQFTGITEPKKVGDVIVLPITSFSPGVGQMGSGDDDDPMAFVKHVFYGSWKPESERHIGEKQDPKSTKGQSKPDAKAGAGRKQQ